MRRITAFAALVSSTVVLSALPAFGADTGTLDAHVTVAAPCLTVQKISGGTELDFGTLPFSPSAANPSQKDTAYHQVTNCGTSPEAVHVRGTDATSSTSNVTWALSSSTPAVGVSQNVYAMRVTSDATSQSTLLATSNRLLFPTVAANTTNSLLLARLFMPLAGSAGAGETMNFQIIYTASL
jgi:hypothetical protein